MHWMDMTEWLTECALDVSWLIFIEELTKYGVSFVSAKSDRCKILLCGGHYRGMYKRDMYRQSTVPSQTSLQQGLS